MHSFIDYGDHPIVDTDLWYAFGKCELDVKLTVVVNRTGLLGLFGPTVKSIHMTGDQLDLYDWDYELDSNEVKVQAGFPTLGTSGHVFRTHVHVDDDLSSLNSVTHYSF